MVTFSRLMRSRVALYQAALFSSLLHLPHLWWIDNYNKGFQKALAKLDTGSYIRIDSTCFVLVLLKQPPTQPTACQLQSVQEQNTLPTTFSLKHLDLFVSSFDEAESSTIYSLAVALQVWNNPLRPPGACTPREFATKCLEGATVSKTLMLQH
jgi:hypothetical protein